MLKWLQIRLLHVSLLYLFPMIYPDMASAQNPLRITNSDITLAVGDIWMGMAELPARLVVILILRILFCVDWDMLLGRLLSYWKNVMVIIPTGVLVNG